MRRIALLLALLFFSGLTFAQEENALWNLFGPEGFGQNKCHYYKLDWQVVETDHFKIYYYDEAVIERQFPELVESIYDEYCQRFQVDSLLRKYEIVIYLTEEHFWSSYILGPYGVLMPEGMYGVFTLDKFLTVATADGDYHAFEHRLRHEMAHLFTMDKVLARVKMARQEARKVWREYQGKKQKITPMDPSLRFNPKKLEEARKKGDSLETPIWPNDIKLLPMPIWWVEGIAEYFSSDYRAQQEDAPFLKDAVLHNWLIPVEHFNQRDGWMVRYVEAPNLLSFIGENKIIELIDSTTILIQYGSRSASYWPGDAIPSLSRKKGEKEDNFDTRFQRIMGPYRKLSLRWQEELKKRFMSEYLGDESVLEIFAQPIVERAISPTISDSNLAYLTIRGGRMRLIVNQKEIASDQRPGQESFHLAETDLGA